MDVLDGVQRKRGMVSTCWYAETCITVAVFGLLHLHELSDFQEMHLQRGYSVQTGTSLPLPSKHNSFGTEVFDPMEQNLRNHMF